jgi:hypothetical protein
MTSCLISSRNVTSSMISGDDLAVALPAAVVANGYQHAEDLRAVVDDIKAQGHVSLRAIASALNDRGMLTRRGGQWQVSNVQNFLARIDRNSVSAN